MAEHLKCDANCPHCHLSLAVRDYLDQHPEVDLGTMAGAVMNVLLDILVSMDDVQVLGAAAVAFIQGCQSIADGSYTDGKTMVEDMPAAMQ